MSLRVTTAPRSRTSLPLFALLSVGALGALAVNVTACSSDSDGASEFDAGSNSTDVDGSNPQGPIFGDDDGGTDNDTDADTPPIGTLIAIIRDFKKHDKTPNTNPDFENAAFSNGDGDNTEFPGAGVGSGLSIVKETLGADGTPDYNTDASWNGTAGRTKTTNGKDWFQQWYHDTTNFNVVRKVPIQLNKDASGVYTYDSAVSGIGEDPAKPNENKGFWPIDDGSSYATTADGFGNQGNPHNYHFTVEIRTKFKYKGTETFKFSGDDDVFVFINKKLVINIGGIHSALTQEVKLADVASTIGLEVGKEYSLDFFQAERHITQSNLRIDTTIDLQPVIVR